MRKKNSATTGESFNTPFSVSNKQSKINKKNHSKNRYEQHD